GGLTSPWACCIGSDLGTGYRFAANTGGSGPFSYEALVPLPQGAFLDSWRAFFYDDSGSKNFFIELKKFYDDTTASPTVEGVALHTSPPSGPPGVPNHPQPENPPTDLREPPPGSAATRADAADFYAFRVSMPADFNVGFKGVRVFWHRQVSPAPAVASFMDVPTGDQGYQYIEALFASGITAGCRTSPPKYCPDDTLTRRQMAVFLAKALGLHWPSF